MKTQSAIPNRSVGPARRNPRPRAATFALIASLLGLAGIMQACAVAAGAAAGAGAGYVAGHEAADGD